MVKHFELNNNTKNNFLNYKGKMVFKSKNNVQQAIYDHFVNIFDKNKNGILESNEIKNIWSEIKSADANNDNKIDDFEAMNFLHTKNSISDEIKGDNLISFLTSINKTIENKNLKQKNNTGKQNILEEYSYENLKQKFSGNEYEFHNDIDNNGFYIDKNNDLFMRVERDNNNVITEIYDCSDKNNPIYTKYDKQGNKIQIIKYENDMGKIIYDKEHEIIKSINNDISEKKWHIIPTTAKEIEKHIKQITPENIESVIKNYKYQYGSSLVSDIDSEWGLDNNIKKRIKNYLNQCLIKSEYWEKNKPNCKIDGEFNQEINDCFFLATITAMAVKPKGLVILNNTIKENPDGSYTVKFKGANEYYTVTPLEIIDFKGARGDNDIKLLEIAANKYWIDGIKFGGTTPFAMDLLCGTNNKWNSILKILNPFDNNNEEELRKIIKDPDTVVTSSIDIFLRMFMKTKDKEYKDEIGLKHSYAVVDMDDKYVYLKNPWHTGNPTKIHTDKTFKLPIKEFKKHLTDVTYVKLK